MNKSIFITTVFLLSMCRFCVGQAQEKYISVSNFEILKYSQFENIIFDQSTRSFKNIDDPSELNFNVGFTLMSCWVDFYNKNLMLTIKNSDKNSKDGYIYLSNEIEKNVLPFDSILRGDSKLISISSVSRQNSFLYIYSDGCRVARLGLSSLFEQPKKERIRDYNFKGNPNFLVNGDSKFLQKSQVKGISCYLKISDTEAIGTFLVTSFEMKVINESGNSTSFYSNSNQLTPEMKEELLVTPIESKIVFSDIKVRFDGKSRYINEQFIYSLEE